MLFSMRSPIVGMGIVTTAIAAVTASEWHDAFIGAIAAAAALVTLFRLLTINAYRRACPVTDPAALARWERRYAYGSYAFALLLGVLNMRALSFHNPILHMITVSLVFSFGAGIVSRISIRPLICVPSQLLATVPTIGALAVHALTPHDSPLHAQFFAIEAFLVAMITVMSLQTVGHLYRTTVKHHTAEHDMAQIAKHDALTGLANRLLLRERFQESILATTRNGASVALHFIDLDGFKAVNDGRGHLAGDMVLQQVSQRLQGAVRADDTVARLGGDEFVVVQVDVRHNSEAELLARRIIKQLTAPYPLEDGAPARISASIGIALAPEFGTELEALLSHADAALYRSKSAGKSRLTFCTAEDCVQVQPAAAIQAGRHA